MPRNETLHPQSPARCQAVETRVVNDRDPLRRRQHVVQCSLPRHGDSIEHQWCGRKFGEPHAPRKRTRQPQRCAETEVREIGYRRYKGPKRLMRVRCSLELNHAGEHEHKGRNFGTPAPRKAGGRHKKKILTSA